MRFSHTDVSVPDFDFYRRPSTKSPNAHTNETQGSRQTFNYMVTGGMLCPS